MNIVVLAGGLSAERDVSISSGSNVFAALNTSGHNAVLLDVFFGYADNFDRIFIDRLDTLGSMANIGKSVPDANKLRQLRGDCDTGDIGPNVIGICRAADIVFMALHGENGENGKLQAMFDVMGIRYTGSGSLGSAIAMNKEISKQILQSRGITMPAGTTLTRDDLSSFDYIGALPAVVKPCSGGSSVGVSIAYTVDELKAAIRTAFSFEDKILVERYIKGREFSVGVLGSQALPIIEVIPGQGFYDYVNKYQAGLTKEICPAEIPPEIAAKMQNIACSVHRILGLEIYSRIDFIMDEHENLYCLEANSLPGMTPFSLIPQEAAAAGTDYRRLCEKIIEQSMLKYASSQMKPMRLRDVAAAVRGKLIGDDAIITDITIDSRKARPGSLFIPIRGNTYNGMDFVHSAYENGAVCCLAEQPIVTDKPSIIVKSCASALEDIAEYYRGLFNVNVIGITGSTGKTTTKEMICAILSKKYHVLKNQGNMNNEIGLPLTLFQLREKHEIAVLEMGMNHAGEIRNLSKTARPDIAVITNIGVAHIENLGSREKILQAKSEIFAHMPDGAKVYINGDDDLLSTLEVKNLVVTTFGLGAQNAFYATNIVSHGLSGTTCDIVCEAGQISVSIPSPGRHMIYNALAAAAVGWDYGVPEQQIIDGIADFKPLGSRMNILEIGRITVIDDDYNANPVSMKAAIDVLAYAPNRKVCILGDMFELGESAADFHYDVGKYACERGVDLLICVGENAKHYAQGALDHGKSCAALAFTEQKEMLKTLDTLIEPSDTVLVKASRGMRFEDIVSRLKMIYEGR